MRFILFTVILHCWIIGSVCLYDGFVSRFIVGLHLSLISVALSRLIRFLSLSPEKALLVRNKLIMFKTVRLCITYNPKRNILVINSQAVGIIDRIKLLFLCYGCMTL